jgi:hypothetical protein
MSNSAKTQNAPREDHFNSFSRDAFFTEWKAPGITRWLSRFSSLQTPCPALSRPGRGERRVRFFSLISSESSDRPSLR